MNAFLYLHPITHINCYQKLPRVYFLAILFIPRVTTALTQSPIGCTHQDMSSSMRQSFLVFPIPRSALPLFPLLPILTLGSIFCSYSIPAVTTLCCLFLLVLAHYPLVFVLILLIMFLHLPQISFHPLTGPQTHIFPLVFVQLLLVLFLHLS